MSSGRMEENPSQTSQDKKLAEGLAEQLAEANRTISLLSQDLDSLQMEQKLARRLAAVGATDLEAAVLIAKSRIQGTADTDVEACVEQLRKEKAYLFGGSTEPATFRKTAGARDRVGQARTALEQAASKAARTGRRDDLLHYLKLRRTLV